MARTFAERTRVSLELATVTCDLCKAVSTYREEWITSPSPGAETTEAVTLEHDAVTNFTPNYGDCGERRVTTVDLCPRCFTGKLLPWLKEQGVEPAVKESEW